MKYLGVEISAEDAKLIEQGEKFAAAKGRAYLRAHPDKRKLLEANYQALEAARAKLGNPSGGSMEEFVRQGGIALAMKEYFAMRSGPVTKKIIRESLGWVPPGADELLQPPPQKLQSPARANAGAARRRGSS